jgi:hypothetical protein
MIQAPGHIGHADQIFQWASTLAYIVTTFVKTSFNLYKTLMSKNFFVTNDKLVRLLLASIFRLDLFL